MQTIDTTTLANHFPTASMTVTGSPTPSIRRPVLDPSAARGRTEDALVDRLAADGDIDAAEELRHRYEHHLMNVAVSLVNDEIDAAQIVEASLEDAFRGWPPERGQVRKWLVRLVRRRARAHRKLLGLDS